jgi:hypothetical protein
MVKEVSSPHVGQEAEKIHKRMEPGKNTVPKDTPPVTYFFPPGSTFYSSTIS